MTQPGGAFRVLVVEDEPLARAGLVALIETDAELECIGAVASVREARETIAHDTPEILILDINLPDGSGFDVLAAIADAPNPPVVVFATAHDRFAVRAFEASAIDYLVKPFDNPRFRSAMNRAKRTRRNAQAAELADDVRRMLATQSPRTVPAATTSSATPMEFMTRLAIRMGTEVMFVNAADVIWIQAEDYYARVHVASKSYLIRESLTALEGKLDPSRFMRVHRSAIVNVDSIARLQPSIRGEHTLLLRTGARVALTRARRRPLEELLRRGS